MSAIRVARIQEVKVQRDGKPVRVKTYLYCISTVNVHIIQQYMLNPYINTLQDILIMISFTNDYIIYIF